MSAPRTGRRQHPQQVTRSRRELVETLKKAAIWVFIFVFLTSILGVAFLSVRTR